jgi:hypothetical protein
MSSSLAPPPGHQLQTRRQVRRKRASKARALASERPDVVSAPETRCPFAAVTSVLNAANEPATSPNETKRPPGPPAFSLESALDVSHILRSGLHGAMLHFERKWGSTCRCVLQRQRWSCHLSTSHRATCERQPLGTMRVACPIAHGDAHIAVCHDMHRCTVLSTCSCPFHELQT